MTVRVNGIVTESIVDGPGFRYVLFTQGCFHACKECHNPLTHDINGGYDISFDDVANYVKNDPLNMGITFSGGEPMLQAEKLSKLCDMLENKHKMVYSGFTFEQILSDPAKKDFLLKCDLLVDGKFEIDKKNLLLNFRGSENQRIIDIKKSLEQNTVILSELNTTNE